MQGVPAELRAVVQALVVNAVEASPEGGLVTVRVDTGDGGCVRLEVMDEGPGLAPEVREKLFTPFFTTKPTGEGTGLGLSLSYDIITQQHRGSIDAESEEGAFTEFTIRLPRQFAHGKRDHERGAS